MIEEQLNLFECEHPCRCGLRCHCETCTPERCTYFDGVDAETCKFFDESDEDVIDELIDELEQQEYQDDISLVLAHDEVRGLTVNMLEVLSAYDRIDEGDENIFIPAPVIARPAAEKLYDKLYAITECLQSVRKNRQDTN